MHAISLDVLVHFCLFIYLLVCNLKENFRLVIMKSQQTKKSLR